MSIDLRAGTAADAPAIHALIAANVAGGHLLPRSLDDVAAHAGRFVVAADEGLVVGCAELAPLSGEVAEVRSLVVDADARGCRTGPRLIDALAGRARDRGFTTLCAFTHAPSHFVRLGFSIVPHAWMPEKIARDCASCRWFRHCGQYAVSFALRPGMAAVRARAAAPRRVAFTRTSVERFRLVPVPAHPLDPGDAATVAVPVAPLGIEVPA